MKKDKLAGRSKETKKVELGDGEPSPKCKSCKTVLYRTLGEKGEYCDQCGAAQEVSPSANFVSEIRPRPDDPSCHVCGAQMVVKEWKCLSCKATTGVDEVSPPSPRDQNMMRNRFEKWANAKGTMGDSWNGDHYENLLHESAWQAWQAAENYVDGFLVVERNNHQVSIQQWEGDTRELKAALEKERKSPR